MSEEFVIIREFNASRELVFKMWTDPKHLNNWWGPVGFKVKTEKIELKPGGIFHYSMETPDGDMMYGKFIYQEIVVPEKLVFIDSFSDKEGGITRHPLAPKWPAEILNTLLFIEQNGKTILKMTNVAINSNEDEEKTFVDGMASLTQGWGGTLSQLENYLNSISNP